MRDNHHTQLYIVHYTIFVNKFQYFFEIYHYILYLNAEICVKNAARKAPEPQY